MSDPMNFDSLVAFNPLGFSWGQRGNFRAPYRRQHGQPNECRWCGVAVKPPRSSWCGARCIAAYALRSHWGVMRRAIIRRDKTCRLCLADCTRIECDVDHISAVVAGGTDDPANLRLLCRPCHLGVTARQARARALARLVAP